MQKGGTNSNPHIFQLEKGIAGQGFRDQYQIAAMILILADDFSGAAELAGIAANHGLRAEVQTRFDPDSSADVIALDTDTRLLSEAAAGHCVSEVAASLQGVSVSWLFKKTDSVLRGHIRAEIAAILTATGLADCLLIPANPSKGRIIREGRCVIDGVPLEQTVFAHDPEHPRGHSLVAELLGRDDRIRVPDVTSLEDIEREAANLGVGTLPAGAADFFTALLRRRSAARRPAEALPDDDFPRLCVSGSAAAWDSGRAEEMRGRGVVVLPLREPPAEWTDEVERILGCHGSVMMAIGRPSGELSPAELTRRLVAAALPFADRPGLRIALEGGATAVAFIKAAGWERLRVLPGGGSGIARLETPTGELWVKPGSYPWPNGPTLV
ncbi:MAG: four-carbon acid sugar kinase family protein [Verrucomicrobiales bacterium]